MTGPTDLATADGVAATIDDDVAIVELQRAPNNFFDLAMIRRIADVYQALAADNAARAIVLCAEGKHFCAGADFSGAGAGTGGGPGDLYREAVRIFAADLPVVAAVQGAAIGGGLGLACSADFRVASPKARFSANFAQLGFHHGFALSATLPAIVGQQHALDLLYTGRRLDGTEAARIGLADRLSGDDDVRDVALDMARSIASSAPLAVRSIRRTMRAALVESVRLAVDREAAEQLQLQQTADWREGVRASIERRTPAFRGE